MQKLFTTLLFALSTFAQAPADFTVVQASSKQVQLSWTGGQPAYVVERKPLGGVYSALPANADPAAATYTDTTIAPFETYVYRVRVRLSATELGDPSDEYTVGPPPVGLTLASPSAPAIAANGLTATSNFGARIRAALDSNGDVAFGYLIYAPQEDVEKSFIEFVTWNRAAYKWNAPRKAVVSGDVLGSGPEAKNWGLARDAATNTWGLAYIKNGTNPWVAFSRDNGDTWTENQVFDCGEQTCRQIGLAMGAGKVHLATLRSPEGVRYITGDITTPAASWTNQVIPKPSGGLEALASLDVALDNADQPAVAFWNNTDTYNLILSYWRPGASTLSIMDTAGYQTDAPGVDLEFFGPRARVVATARRTEEFFSRYDQNLWVVRDLSGSFGMPENLPSDGEVTLDYPALAVGSVGQMTVAATEAGGTGANVRCGLMKLVQKNSDSESWSACSPFPRDGQPFYDVNYPRVIYAPNDSRYVVFTNTGTDSQLPGVIVWRER